MLVRIPRNLIPRLNRRVYLQFSSKLSTTNDADDLTHEKRKEIITTNTDHYYPPISTVRQKLSPSEGKRIKTFRDLFDNVVQFQGENNKSVDSYLLEGRVSNIRKAGKAMYFIDLIQDDYKVQIMAMNKLMGLTSDEFNQIHGFLKVGDYVGVCGQASRTNLGELTLKLNRPIELLTPCLDRLPNKLTDKGFINNNRVLNYLVNPESKRPIIVKSKVIQAIRTFLLNRDFLEVQTPILSGQGTGANATPFITNYKSVPIHLRVAPELWLKKFVIGGFDKVFEIGSNFRNEGIDMTHNPEFTSCEFYQAFTSLDELMKMTEDLYRFVFSELGVENKLPAGEFPKYEFLPTLEKRTGKPLADLSLETLISYHEDLGIDVPKDPNPVKLLNNLCEIYLESLCLEHPKNTPVFIYNQPEVMSPLAKSTVDSKGNRISLRFELFINQKEMANAYEEENDPAKQLEKFTLQQQMKTEYNDQEMLIPDNNYVDVMKWGLPPTGGWGCGVDRLAMLIAEVERIEEVLPFGNLQSVLRN
ncbi:msk1 Lysine--tRNA ligase [Candida maltosa Xu316]|uniref:Lysyl-tRNA synthetase n=1 Tax=Candida maltosa (strain Xu316) TaxID=1245528 RepID=M3IMN5_CANMX|nr:Lysyl-tRNA synthetase [Candida maltosa Xu316]